MLHPAEIRRLRERIGWSARELARRAKVSVQWVSDVEKGGNQNPGWKHLSAVEDAFREALAELAEAMGILEAQSEDRDQDPGPERGFLLLSRDETLRRQLGLSDQLTQELLSFRMKGTVKTVEDAIPHALAAKAALERAARPAGQ